MASQGSIMGHFSKSTTSSLTPVQSSKASPRTIETSETKRESDKNDLLRDAHKGMSQQNSRLGDASQMVGSAAQGNRDGELRNSTSGALVEASQNEYTTSSAHPQSVRHEAMQDAASSQISDLDHCDAQSPAEQPPHNSRIIKDSDDEGSDSDSSLEDLNVLLAARQPVPTQTAAPRPKTPESNLPKHVNFHKSPLTVLSRTKSDMNALLSHARDDAAFEESSKKLKALMAVGRNQDDAESAIRNAVGVKDLSKNSLLQSVVADQEDGSAAKVARALLRTEAVVTETRFTFFHTISHKSEARLPRFPDSKLPKEWQDVFTDTQMREQSFTCGFVEDMLVLGNVLPDPVIAWMAEALCVETRNSVRTSYLRTLQQCSNQVTSLMLPAKIQQLFQLLGGTEMATSLTTNIMPATTVFEQYYHRDWGNLCDVLRLLGRCSILIGRDARIAAVCTLLRLSADRVVLHNVDVLTELQEAMSYILMAVPEEDWVEDCAVICRTIFEHVQQLTFREQIVSIMTSGLPRVHDLQRRLALGFFFNNIDHCRQNSQEQMDLKRFAERLDDKEFDAGPNTDFPQLTALIRILDIAIDDGRPMGLNLQDTENEVLFNKDVDNLVLVIKGIMTSIGNPGAAFLSRIEAKETLELISQRVADIVRTKRKPKESWFNRRLVQDKWASEKKGMSHFIGKKEISSTKAEER